MHVGARRGTLGFVTGHRNATPRLYHGTRSHLEPGDLIEPRDQPRDPPRGGTAADVTACVYLTTSLDAAIWDAEIAAGDGPGRVYEVEATGAVEHPAGPRPPGPPSMASWSRAALRVAAEVTEWVHYHGTNADLKPGDLIKPGHSANYGEAPRTANHVYFARTLDAATWGAELAAGDGRGRIYIVEPTGPFEDDPNLTDRKFRGNPTKSFRSRHPVRVTGELTDWQGHAPEALKAMRDGLAELARRGTMQIDD